MFTHAADNPIARSIAAASSPTKRLCEIEETTDLLRSNLDLLEQAVARLCQRLAPVQRSDPDAASASVRPTPTLSTPLGGELYAIADRLITMKACLDYHADRLEI